MTVDVARSLFDAREFHTILGIELGASAEQIQRARRKLQLGAHSDKGGSDEVSALINAAADELLKRCRGTWRDVFGTAQPPVWGFGYESRIAILKEAIDYAVSKEQDLLEKLHRCRLTSKASYEITLKKIRDGLAENVRKLDAVQSEYSARVADARAHHDQCLIEEEARRREEAEHHIRAEEEKRERTLQRERWLAQEAVRRQRTGLADSMRSVLRRTKTDAGHRFPVLAESLAEAFPTASRRLRALSARYGEERQAYHCKVGKDHKKRDELLEKARALVYVVEYEIVMRRGIQATSFPQTQRFGESCPTKALGLKRLYYDYRTATKALANLIRKRRPTALSYISVRRLVRQAWELACLPPAYPNQVYEAWSLYDYECDPEGGREVTTLKQKSTEEPLRATSLGLPLGPPLECPQSAISKQLASRYRQELRMTPPSFVKSGMPLSEGDIIERKRKLMVYEAASRTCNKRARVSEDFSNKSL